MTSEIRYALDPVLWAREALGFEPDWWQAQVMESTQKRIIMNCARQSGKSTVAALMGLHRALFFPGSLILLVSPSFRQSGELFRKVGDAITRLDLHKNLTEDNMLSLKMRNGSRIVSLPGQEATIRGFSGANLIIEDEASRVSDDLYFAIRPMLAVSNGRLILMSTPFGKRGHFHKEWTEGEGWERTRITALECPRISPSFLEQERAALGNWWFRQEYECEFTETEDSVFPYDLIMSAVTDEVKPLFFGAGG